MGWYVYLTPENCIGIVHNCPNEAETHTILPPEAMIELIPKIAELVTEAMKRKEAMKQKELRGELKILS